MTTVNISFIIKYLNERGDFGLTKENFKTIADNRAVRHNYFVVESFETGIELVGTEVKSIRGGGVNLKDSWCSIDDGELFVKGMHVSPYEKAIYLTKTTIRVKESSLHTSVKR